VEDWNVIGLLPKVAALTTIIPVPVLGGAMIPMFGMVVASGIKMLSRVDFNRNENLLVVACSVGIGLGAAVVPATFEHLPQSLQLIAGNGIVLGSMSAIILNIILNYKEVQSSSSDEQIERTKQGHQSEEITI
jgi:xanthine permease